MLPQKKMTEIVVSQHCCTETMFEKSKQKVYLSHCIQKIKISKFYGPYCIYDGWNRLIAKSDKDNSVHLTKDHLQTDTARVWYDSIASHSVEYKTLISKGVKDPGICFSHIPEVYIVFDNAPDAKEEPKRVFYHIPIFYVVLNIWDPDKKVLKF